MQNLNLSYFFFFDSLKVNLFLIFTIKYVANEQKDFMV